MQQFVSRLGRYDLIGYLVPGALALWASVSVAQAFLGARPPQQPASDLMDATVFVVASYIAGNLFQTMGNWLEAWHNARHGGFPSTRYLRHDDTHYPIVFKTRLRELAGQAFSLGPDATPQQLFDLCYTYTQVRGLDAHIQIMNSRYGFYRGLTVATGIAAVVFVLKTGLDAVLTYRDPGAYWRELPQSFLLAVLFLAGTVLAFNRWQRFGARFADHVYRTFFVACSVTPNGERKS